MENFNYLFAAYAIIFGVIAAYVLYLWRRQVALEAALRALEHKLDSLEAGRKAGRASDNP
jgi:CcmD family protein